MARFEKTFEVKWSDLDPNFHLRGSVYLDFTDQTRFSFFTNNGLPVDKWRHWGFGPVILEETIKFKKEVLLEEKVVVNFQLGYISEDNRIFKIKHEIKKEDGMLAAEVLVTVGLLDLKTRKLVAAPEEFLTIIDQMEKAEKAF